MLKYINIVGTLALAALASILPVAAGDTIVRMAKGVALYELGGAPTDQSYRTMTDARLDAALFRVADAISMSQLDVWIAARAAAETKVAAR